LAGMRVSTGFRDEEKGSRQLGLFGEDSRVARAEPEDPTEESPSRSPVEGIVEVALDHLNRLTERTGVARFTSPTSIKERVRDGAAREDLLLVIDFCYAMWWGDPKMETFVRPKTLFGKENFPDYLVRARKWHSDGRPSMKLARQRLDSQGGYARGVEYYAGKVEKEKDS